VVHRQKEVESLRDCVEPVLHGGRGWPVLVSVRAHRVSRERCWAVAVG
jgi:hypothetical protein